MRRYFIAACAALLVGAFLFPPTALATTTVTLMDPVTNDGSFESNPPPGGSGINLSPVALAGWSIVSTGPSAGGLLTRPPHNFTLQGADGADALFADGSIPNPNTTTATSVDLLGGAYGAVAAGDEFTWSFKVDSWSANSSGSLSLDFGSGPVLLGSGITGDTNLASFTTISGTYTATAADAAGGQLEVVFSISTSGPTPNFVNVYGDDVRLSVEFEPNSDSDGDGVVDDDDVCDGTVIPDPTIPTVVLGTNRWALVDDNGDFDTVDPKGEGPQRSYTIVDTAGCNAEQIADALGLGNGHYKHGLSNSAMDEWVALVSP